MIQNFYSDLLKRSSISLQRYLHNKGNSSSNHYETLKVQRNCTSKEIRNSFLKLSKENHPDLNKDPNAHKQFVKIQEAYDVLSKPELRASYDFSLSTPGYRHGIEVPPRQRYGQKPYNPWDDPAFYSNHDKSQDAFYKARPYYGVDGIKKVSNEAVAMYCILLAIISFGVQMFFVKYSYTLRRERMIDQSNELQETLNEVKERASRNGNKVQVEIMRQQFEEQERRRLNYRNNIE